MTDDETLIQAFHGGQKCAERGGYLSDNPHSYESLSWEAWRAGFEDEEGPSYRKGSAA